MCLVEALVLIISFVPSIFYFIKKIVDSR